MHQAAGPLLAEAVILVGEQQRLAGGDGQQRESEHGHQNVDVGAEIARRAQRPRLGPDDAGKNQKRRQRQHQQAEVVERPAHGADQEQQRGDPGDQRSDVEEAQMQPSFGDDAGVEQDAVQRDGGKGEYRQLRRGALDRALPACQASPENDGGGDVERHAHQREGQDPGVHGGMMPTFPEAAKDGDSHRPRQDC